MARTVSYDNDDVSQYIHRMKEGGYTAQHPSDKGEEVRSQYIIKAIEWMRDAAETKVNIR